MILRDWVDINKLNWEMLSQNPNAIDLLRDVPHKIDWTYMSRNPRCHRLIKSQS
jgi:hypothetical protein